MGSISSEQRIVIEKAKLQRNLIGSEGSHRELRVRLVLQPSRFLFQLELPSRAGEFLEGVVRAQLDGLTPWSAAEAAFGWSKPAEVAGGRITLTIAATARSLILPHLQPIANLGARSIVVTTSADKTDTNRIRVWEQRAGRGVVQAARIRSWLVTLLAVSGSAAALAVSASMIAGPILDARQQALMRHVREIGATSSDSRGVASGSAAAAWQLLERRKNDRPPNVIVLETLSQILPDRTYVTELRVEDDKLKISAITQDAPP